MLHSELNLRTQATAQEALNRGISGHTKRQMSSDLFFIAKQNCSFVLFKFSFLFCRFRKALDDVILSSSPYIRPDIPYLETDAGSKCLLRSHFASDVYWSRYFEPEKYVCSPFS